MATIFAPEFLEHLITNGLELPIKLSSETEAVSIEGVPSRSAGLRAVFPRIQYSDHLDQATPT